MNAIRNEKVQLRQNGDKIELKLNNNFFKIKTHNNFDKDVHKVRGIMASECIVTS